jgi:pimeloyl-ACP methyl ester carboxylesterase
MSTPPFVDLPAGVSVERWPVRGSERAVMHAGLDRGDEWVVLVPGFTGSKEDFIAVLPLLDAAGIGAVAIDQLGQFESDGSDAPSDYALPLLAEDVAEVINKARMRSGRADQPHLLGHSFGGLVAQEAVAGGAVRPASLVLLCTGPGALPPARWEALPDLVAALEHADLAQIWRIMRDMELAEDIVPPAPDVAAFLERRWHANNPVQLREFAIALMQQPPLTPRVADASTGLPIAVLWGEHDDAWPIEMQRGMASLLGASAIELGGVGHSPNATDPQQLVEALLVAWGR